MRTMNRKRKDVNKQGGMGNRSARAMRCNVAQDQGRCGGVSARDRDQARSYIS